MPAAPQLHAYCRANEAWLLDTIQSLAAIESPTSDKAAVDRCGAELAKRMQAIGGRVSRVEASSAGDHLRAEFGDGA